MINKHKNICIGVYWNNISFPGFKLSGWANTVEYMVEGGQKTEWKKRQSLIALLSSACPYTPHCMVL